MAQSNRFEMERNRAFEILCRDEKFKSLLDKIDQYSLESGFSDQNDDNVRLPYGVTPKREKQNWKLGAS